MKKYLIVFDQKARELASGSDDLPKFPSNPAKVLNLTDSCSGKQGKPLVGRDNPMSEPLGPHFFRDARFMENLNGRGPAESSSQISRIFRLANQRR